MILLGTLLLLVLDISYAGKQFYSVGSVFFILLLALSLICEDHLKSNPISAFIHQQQSVLALKFQIIISQITTTPISVSRHVSQ